MGRDITAAEHNFFGIQDWKQPISENNFDYDNNENVIILRSILFFHSEQKVKLYDIQKYFTGEAINKLINDKFIEING